MTISKNIHCRQGLGVVYKDSTYEVAIHARNEAMAAAQNASAFEQEANIHADRAQEIVDNFNANVESKITSFDVNAQEKLASYNQNHNDKLEVYNSNDMTKFNAYNANDASKTLSFNDNYTQKLAAVTAEGNKQVAHVISEGDSKVNLATQQADRAQNIVNAFDVNANEKTNAYNSNANEKLSAYNQNHDTKFKSYNDNAVAKQILVNESAALATEKAGIASSKAEEASVSAAASKASETAAKSSETSATEAAKTATQKATEAEESASAAASSQTLVTQNATTATTKATEALTSATQAKSSQIACETAVQTATQKATEATNASNTATDAKNTATEQATLAYDNAELATQKAQEAQISANNAATSEINTLTYKNQAQTFTNNAAGSESNALASKTAASVSAAAAQISEKNAAASAVTAKTEADRAADIASNIGDPANRDLSNLTPEGQGKFDAKQDILTPGNNIQIDENGVISTNATPLPLFVSFKTGHILNNASYVNGRLFSWLSGSVYTTAYQELVKEMTGSEAGQITTQTLYAWGSEEYVIYTQTLTPTSDSDLRNADGTAYVFDGTYPKYFVDDGVVDGYLSAKNEGLGEGLGLVRLEAMDKTIAQTIAEQKTQTIAGVTVTYYVTDTNKKICLADQADTVASIYTATGAADFYLLDTANRQFKLPRRNTRRLLRNWKQGDEWYNLYSDGWCVQGGITKSGTASNNNFTQTFLVKMADTYYRAIGIYTANTKTNAHLFAADELYGSRTPTSAVYRLDSEDNYWTLDGNQYLTWKIEGYADTSLIADEFEYEYYFVGNTVQNQTAIDVGQITQALSAKADADLSNTAPSAVFKSQSASWAMPSEDYVDLTLEASGSEYTAPANGYVFLAKGSGGSNKFVSVGIKNASSVSVLEDYNALSSTAAQNLTILFPISKGAKFIITYNATGATNFFRFIYAKGEK